MSPTFGYKFIAVQSFIETLERDISVLCFNRWQTFSSSFGFDVPLFPSIFWPYTVGLASFSWLFEGFMADFSCVIPGSTVSREEPVFE